MKPDHVRRTLTLFACGAAALAGWFAYGWLTEPMTYRLGVVYIIIVMCTGTINLYALRRYNDLLSAVIASHAHGQADDSEVLFARNQRFRYTIRALESFHIFVLGILIIWASFVPSLGTSQGLGYFFLFYLIGSPTVTGYLTYRDLHVLNAVQSSWAAEDVGV